MNWKIATISVISGILYAYILAFFGIAGDNIQSIALSIGAIVLKYGLILFGFFMVLFLPYRINKALIKRKEMLYEIESNKKITDAAKKQKELNNKILNEYIKNEDAI